jgi:hypothetical protein
MAILEVKNIFFSIHFNTIYAQNIAAIQEYFERFFVEANTQIKHNTLRAIFCEIQFFSRFKKFHTATEKMF